MSRATYTYGTYRTEADAWAGLEDDFADGAVSPGEFARIEKRGKRWHVLLWDF
jgi:hypothetical protein